MRISAIHGEDIPPIQVIDVAGLSDIVVFAGPNGVGKTRFIQWLLQIFQNPKADPKQWIIVDATSDDEASAWGKRSLDTRLPNDAKILRNYLQRPKTRGKQVSSILNFDSNRSITEIQPFQFTWDYSDPFAEEVGWNFGFNSLSSRFSDTVHSIFRKVRSRRETIALAAEKLMREAKEKDGAVKDGVELSSRAGDGVDCTSAANGQEADGSEDPRPGQDTKEGQITLNPSDFPDPLDPFRKAFSQLLAPKRLVDPDAAKQQLFFSDPSETEFPLKSLSSGEREVVNVVFDFLLRNPSDCIVFFDEPELHLHPELSYKLLQTLRTAGKRNQFIFCTHSAEIITASLDYSVVFISPPKGVGVNQAVVVREEDETHQALQLMGQSIGIISLGKKIVLIEGEQSSLDKQTYGAILKSRFPSLALVPSGGKGLIQSFDRILDKVVERSIWGIKFFMLCDLDAVPSATHAQSIERRSSGRVRFLKRYHLENYFLDARVIARVFSSMHLEGHWLRDPKAIDEKLLEIARDRLSHATALIVSAHFREIAGNVTIMPKESHGRSADELVSLVSQRVGTEINRLTSSLDVKVVEEYTRQTYERLKNSLADGQWKVEMPGRPIVSVFCSSAYADLDFGRFKLSYLSFAPSFSPSPFQDIEAIFKDFAEA